MEPAPYLRAVRLDGDAAGFRGYPFTLPAVRGLERMELHPEVTFLVGENGTGKSTLLEAIAAAWGLNPEGGSRNLHFATRETHSQLHRALSLEPGGRRAHDGYFLRAESFYNVATALEELDRTDMASLPALGRPIREDFGGGSMHERSHGESFWTVLTERLRGGGLYLLDEPEAALSPTRQLAALARMRDLVRLHSQFIVATHSPILMAYPGALIYLLDDDGIRPVEYTDTEHYVVTREFLNHPERMLRELLQ